MDAFIRRFCQLRDGNMTPAESRLAKTERGEVRKFFVCIREPFESAPPEALHDALYAAAESGCVYAQITFRYEKDPEIYLVCNRLLDEFFFPLGQSGVLGRAVPLIASDEAHWLVELYHISDVPEFETVTLTPTELARRLAAAAAGKPLHPGTRH